MMGFFNERKLVIETRKAVFSQPDVPELCACLSQAASGVREASLPTLRVGA